MNKTRNYIKKACGLVLTVAVMTAVSACGGESVSGDTVQKVTNIEQTKTPAKTAESEDRNSKDFWDTENEVSLHKDGVTYHAYLSKDKKESWIYQAEIGKKVGETINFPSEIEGIKTTVIGNNEELYESDDKDWCTGVFGGYFGGDFEPWHEVDADYNNSVKSLVVPDSVEILAGSALAGLKAVERIKLSDNMEEIYAYTFQNDINLKEITIGKNTKKISPLAFEKCNNLQKFNTVKDGQLILVNNMLVTKDKTELVFVPRKLREAKIPEGVTHICEGAFYRSKASEIWIPSSLQQSTKYTFQHTNIEKWHLADKCGLAKSDTCVYEKKTGELVYIYSNKKVIELPKDVTEIGNKFATLNHNKITIKLPETFEKFGDLYRIQPAWLEIYFTSENPPVVEGDNSMNAPPFIAFIPQKYQENYLDWLEKNYSFDREEDTDEYFIVS